MRLFVFGVGYSVAAYVRRYRRDWDEIAGTTQSLGKARQIEAETPGFKALVFDDASADPQIEPLLARSDALLVSVPPRAADPALHRFGTAIRSSGIRRIVYLSTLGVYGDANGGWVDESTPPDPAVARGSARLEAEKGWLDLAGPRRKVFVLRLAGIYGPDRNAIVNLRDGSARRIVKVGQVFNRIHVDDIARAIAACMSVDHPGGVVNVCDDEPAPPQDVVEYAAGLVGIEPPPEIPFAQAQLSPMAASFWTTNKRVSNRRLREEIGVELAYPTYREGLAALASDS